VIDTYRQAVRILHIDHPLTDTPTLVSTVPASMAGFSDHGALTIGAPARLIVQRTHDQ